MTTSGHFSSTLVSAFQTVIFRFRTACQQNFAQKMITLFCLHWAFRFILGSIFWVRSSRRGRSPIGQMAGRALFACNNICSCATISYVNTNNICSYVQQYLLIYVQQYLMWTQTISAHMWNYASLLRPQETLPLCLLETTQWTQAVSQCCKLILRLSNASKGNTTSSIASPTVLSFKNATAITAAIPALGVIGK